MNREQVDKIAVLLTCHNRREKTLNSLKALFETAKQAAQELDVFLVDDGSTDGTGEAVRNAFSTVNIIQGNGDLFWNGGMRLAWKNAAKSNNYRFYLWLNDDTLFAETAIIELLECFEEALQKDGKPALIVGACKADFNSAQFSYGGRNETEPVEPNGKIQTCKYVNGNAVLVPGEIYKKLGNLSKDYTHGIGDIDYGLRALQNGYNNYTTKKFIAVCPPNDLPAWENPNTPLKNRWQLLHSPRGLNLKEYNTFRKKFWGNKWIIFALKAYLKTLFPVTYNKLSKN